MCGNSHMDMSELWKSDEFSIAADSLQMTTGRLLQQKTFSIIPLILIGNAMYVEKMGNISSVERPGISRNPFSTQQQKHIQNQCRFSHAV